MTTELERIVMTLEPATNAMSAEMRKAVEAARDFRAECALTIIAHEFQVAHPGKRLPGGLSKRRLLKKRIDRLCDWWLTVES